MPKTLINSRLHSKKQKPKLKKNLKFLNQIYLQIYNLSNRNYH